MVDPFSEGGGVKHSKQDVTKVVFLAKTGLSNPLNVKINTWALLFKTNDVDS